MPKGVKYPCVQPRTKRMFKPIVAPEAKGLLPPALAPPLFKTRVVTVLFCHMCMNTVWIYSHKKKKTMGISLFFHKTFDLRSLGYVDIVWHPTNTYGFGEENFLKLFYILHIYFGSSNCTFSVDISDHAKAHQMRLRTWWTRFYYVSTGRKDLSRLDIVYYFFWLWRTYSCQC